MKEIFLNHGKVALVDDDNFEILNSVKWRTCPNRKTLHASRSIVVGKRRYKTVFLHHLVLPLKEGFEVDHKDRNGLNNQRSNLRLCTRSQNKANQRKDKKWSSLFKGVSWVSRDQIWVTRIKFKNRQINLGSFKDEELAARIYDKAAKYLFGEFACLNFI